MKQCLEKPWYAMLYIKFLYRRNVFLAPKLRRLLCNTLIQSHFDYACSVWYPNLTKTLKHQIQTTQNKCMCFSLYLDKLKHISHEAFKRLNWLPLTYRFKQCVSSSISMSSTLIIWMKSLMSPQRITFN